jgi:hypothetical protein
MISYPRSDTSSENPEPPSVRIIGLGNAGAQLADRLQMNGHADVVVMNTDAQSSCRPLSPKRSLLAKDHLRPERAAIRKSATMPPKSRATTFVPPWKGRISFSYAQDLAAAQPQASFQFLRRLHGKPEQWFSQLSLRHSALRDVGAPSSPLRPSLFCPNTLTRLSILRTTGWPISHRRFGHRGDVCRCEPMLCMRWLAIAILRGQPDAHWPGRPSCRCRRRRAAGLFGRGEATGDNRAHEALERALKALFDRGRLIGECHAVIANLVGPASLVFGSCRVMREGDGTPLTTPNCFLVSRQSPIPTRPWSSLSSVTILRSRWQNPRRFLSGQTVGAFDRSLSCSNGIHTARRN